MSGQVGKGLVKKRKKKLSLKRLNNAVKSLLEKDSVESSNVSSGEKIVGMTTSPTTENTILKVENDKHSSLMYKNRVQQTKVQRRLPWLKEKLIDIDANPELDQDTVLGDEAHTDKNLSREIIKNGKSYIMSKENKLIPKLNDDEIMEKHKQADENMKSAWMSIINKYSVNEDDNDYDGVKSDVIDIHTGQIVEDNGHLRSLYKKNTLLNNILSNNGNDSNADGMVRTVRNDKYVSRLLEGYYYDENNKKNFDSSNIKSTKINSNDGLEFDDSESDSDYIDEESEEDQSDLWADDDSL